MTSKVPSRAPTGHLFLGRWVVPRERCSPGTDGPRRRLGTWQAFSCGRVGSPGVARKGRQLDHVTQQCGGTCPARFFKVARPMWRVSPLFTCHANLAVLGRAQSFWESHVANTRDNFSLASCDGSKRQTTVSPPDLIRSVRYSHPASPPPHCDPSFLLFSHP